MQGSAHDTKMIATAFLELVVAGKVREAFDRFVSEQLVHHNVNLSSDRKALLLSMENEHIEHPDRTIAIKHVLKDGNLVAVHSHLTLGGEDPMGRATAHLFRFKGNQIVELWYLSETITNSSVNNNGKF